MAKSRIERLAEKPKFVKGEIVISTQDSITVVLVTGVQPATKHLFAGTKLFNSESDVGFGYWSNEWIKESFVKFNGSVILEND